MFQSRNLWYNTEKPGKAVQLMKMEQLIGILSILLQRSPAGEAAFPNLPKAPPYEGAKDYIWVEDVEDRNTMTALTRLTCLALQE